MKTDGYKSWIELSKRALQDNFKTLQKTAKPAALLPIIKANAYGHGASLVAQILAPFASAYGVDSLDEAESLRKAGIRQPILILGYIPNARLTDAVRQKFEIVIYNQETVQTIRRMKSKTPVRVHIKIDTGIARQGVSLDEFPALVRAIKRVPNIHIVGLATHFANIEDTDNASYAKKQLATFDQALKILTDAGIVPTVCHAACSAALMLYSETRF
ncbi:MAG: alanine racemase, partial [bacterium]|nr:alanine racemase [bacterium]